MKEPERLGWFFKNYIGVFVIYGLVTLAVSVQSLMLEKSTFAQGDVLFPQYNNYLIFKHSFYHLIHSQDLYVPYPAEHGDLYKYSPSFALLMAPFAILPESVGLILWNLLNVFCLFIAIRMLPGENIQGKIMMLLFVIVELITSLQNSQSNILMAGMIILAFAMLERGRFFLAALLIVLTVYIKIFGLFAFALFLFYPNKGKFVVSAIFCSLLLALLPLLVISTSQLIFLYEQWLDLLINDHSVSYGISVMGWLVSWFNILPNKNLVVLVGLIGLGLPLLRWKRYDHYLFRISMLASILIWIVIFNHKAESPTYIIAVAGVAVWYFSQARTMTNFILVILAFVFTTLSPTDIFPASIQDNIFDPYVIKAVPCIIIWMKIIVDSFKKQETLAVKTS